jgi:dTDP-4-dehydrorhamnose 3,5-epimerase
MAIASEASVNNARHRLIELPQRVDARGSLGVAEVGKDIPFDVRRLFYIYGTAPGAGRGAHAHRKLHQWLIMLAGACTIVVDDGSTRTTLRLDSPRVALHAPPLLWLELGDFTADAVCAVLASDHYSESDYIRNHNEFCRLARDARSTCK